MLYKKSADEKLDLKLFENPTAEYRGAPFWAWNCELDLSELLRQADCLKEMGFGGFHMHTRSGMATKYLSDEYMRLIKACTEKAKENGMLAWLYDEDRWPSGAAGGYVTSDVRFAQRRLVFSMKKPEITASKQEAAESGGTYSVGIYDVRLNKHGELAQYKRIENENGAQGTVWYASVKEVEPSGWFNGHSYADTLSKAAIKRFIEVTHERYKEVVGGDFGKSVPAIFTDEPQFAYKNTFKFAESTEDCALPWTCDFDDTFKESYGFDIADKLPELFWELPDGAVSRARYLYHDHICERFTQAFSDTCGSWCAENGINLTGHMLAESTLESQTMAIGEAMRAYRSFQIPGIDMLMNSTEYTTAKQAQSAVHQYGREGMTSELYGVTNWDFDFRGHKFQGDWQAALGVTVRVPHLSWVSMKGSAKRDYPASINYQSPWYKEYPYIEDHFARINTVLTRGKPSVRVGVIHPIESYWLHWGPSDVTAQIRSQMDENFKNITEWLLFGNIDFDFINESCLPNLCGEISDTLSVGEMRYSAILVPQLETMRKTTVDILNKFVKNGGKLIFAGKAPKYVDAELSCEAQKLYNASEQIPFDKLDILNALENEREIDIIDSDGNRPEQFIYQLRTDNDVRRLFIANLAPVKKKDGKPVDAIIKIKGEFTPQEMDTLGGAVKNIRFTAENGVTEVYKTFYENDSLLLTLAPCTERAFTGKTNNESIAAVSDIKSAVDYRRSEDNVCILDIAEYSVDGGNFEPREEILRTDGKIRKIYGWPLADGMDVQPWVIEKEKITHFVTLRFEVESRTELKNVFFCAEELEELNVNGENIVLFEDGYFVDKAVKRYRVPSIKSGMNIILAKVPVGKRTSLEACFLTGDFDVIYNGCTSILAAPSSKIPFGDITRFGMPFYGGNITYKTQLDIDAECDIRINAALYRGALIKVLVDGSEAGKIAFAPYELTVEKLKPGKHTVEYILYGNRVNTFGSLHNCGKSSWVGPDHWYSKGDEWSYEYNLKPVGILKSPVITVIKR